MQFSNFTNKTKTTSSDSTYFMHVPQLISTDKQAFGHHPKKYGKKRLTKAFRVAGKEKKKANAKIVNHYKHKTF